MTGRLAELFDRLRRHPAAGPWRGPVSLVSLFDALADALAVGRIVAGAGRLAPDDVMQLRALLPAAGPR